MKRIIFILFVLTACLGCDRKKEDKPENFNLSENIIGRWEARWEMTGKEVEDYAPRQRKMAGEMAFFENGEVKVTSYGFKGCVFMTDTSVNTMNWKIENQVLRFMDKRDVHGIPYNIEQADVDKIQLSIMENIHLTLTR